MHDKFQSKFQLVRLYDENNVPPDVTKVGILPFIPASVQGEWKVLLMKPRAEAKHLGAPSFQIAKGTRRININGDWCDMREDDLRHADPSFHEPLIDTALREGHEEVGLKASNITTLYDMGGFVFTSASRGLSKPLHMFAAAISDRADFSDFEKSTAETRWIGPLEFSELGRPDHVKILDAILERLVRKLST